MNKLQWKNNFIQRMLSFRDIEWDTGVPMGDKGLKEKFRNFGFFPFIDRISTY